MRKRFILAAVAALAMGMVAVPASAAVPGHVIQFNPGIFSVTAGPKTVMACSQQISPPVAGCQPAYSGHVFTSLTPATCSVVPTVYLPGQTLAEVTPLAVGTCALRVDVSGPGGTLATMRIAPVNP